MGKVEAEALVDTPVDTLAHGKSEALGDTLADMVAVVEARTIADTLGHVDTEALVDRWVTN